MTQGTVTVEIRCRKRWFFYPLLYLLAGIHKLTGRLTEDQVYNALLGALDARIDGKRINLRSDAE